MLNGSNMNAILRASYLFNALFKKTLIANALPEARTKTQMDVLIALYERGPMNMSTLSSTVGIAPEQATRVLKGLKEKGLVTSERNAENRRTVVASLTRKGKNKIATHIQKVTDSLEEVLSELDDEELETLASSAEAAADLLDKAIMR